MKAANENFGAFHTAQGATILDVGCGRGELAALLVKDGFKVTAVDRNEEAVNEAIAAGINAACADFLKFHSQLKFDAVLMSRSLHHIDPVAKAVQHAHALLNDDGLFLLEDFGAELLDQRTALWFYGLKSVVEAGCDVVKSRGPKLENGEIPADPLKSWREHLFGKHNVTESVVFLTALRNYFSVQEEHQLPYLFRYFLDDVTFEQARQIFQWEETLCNSDLISPVGIRFVGRKKSAAQ